jgi:hypothetical protein
MTGWQHAAGAALLPYAAADRQCDNSSERAPHGRLKSIVLCHVAYLGADRTPAGSFQPSALLFRYCRTPHFRLDGCCTVRGASRWTLAHAYAGPARCRRSMCVGIPFVRREAHCILPLLRQANRSSG